MELNKAQMDFLNKEFPVKGLSKHTLSRMEFEGFPCAMMACLFTDEQMTELANRVSIDMEDVDIDENTTNTYDKDEFEDIWYRTIENNALNMGMKYYEDYTEEEIEKMTNEFYKKLK